MGKQPSSPGDKRNEQTHAKRIRRTRAQGEALLLTAASDLLLLHTPDDITVRDIGERATVHHRFINDWFGGKVGLFRAVHETRAKENSDVIASVTTPGSLLPDTLDALKGQISLVTWLMQNGSEFDDLESAFPTIARGRSILIENFGLSADDADKSAYIIGAIILADFQIRPHLNVNQPLVDLIAHHIRSVSQSSGLASDS